MNTKDNETKYNLKGLFTYISTVISWTIFSLLIILGVLLIYYFISVRLYATKGEKYEPAFSVYTIVSQSMTPNINVYDVIINTKVKNIDDVKIGDVITFISTWQVNQGMTITHRVVGKKVLDDGSTCLVTKGDFNQDADQACVKEGNIIGETKAVIPGFGKIQFFLSSKTGWLLIVLLPALYIIIKDIFKIFGLGKEIKEENKINNNKLENNNFDNINEEKKDIDLELAYKDLKKIKKKKKKY